MKQIFYYLTEHKLVFTCIHLLCLTSFITNSRLHAQVLVSKENQWNVAIYPTFSPEYKSYAIRLLDDTLVNGLRYRKIYYSYDKQNTLWEYQNGMLREDTLKRIYYKSEQAAEVLLYDFSLKVKDTFKIPQFCTLQVVEIDTIKLNDGQLRKRLKLMIKDQPIWGHEYWIEGIGSQFGLINHFNFCETDYADVLLCFYIKGNLIYPMSPLICFITENDEASNEPGIKLFPNPFHTKIELNSNNSNFTCFKILNIDGHLMHQGHIDNPITKINLETLDSGIYILVVQKDDGNQQVKRIIKR